VDGQQQHTQDRQLTGQQCTVPWLDRAAVQAKDAGGSGAEQLLRKLIYCLRYRPIPIFETRLPHTLVDKTSCV
jgi:hypothetical protein